MGGEAGANDTYEVSLGDEHLEPPPNSILRERTKEPKSFDQTFEIDMPPTPKQQSWGAKDTSRVVVMLGVCLMSVCFWAVYEQMGNTLALYAERNVDRSITLGGKVLCSFPPEYVQSINPIFILTFTPFVNSLWRWQSRKGNEPKPLTKMAIGCFLLSLGYGLLAFVEVVASASDSKQAEAPADGRTPVPHKVSFIWLILSIVLSTIGELYFSPVGLSFISSIAPASITSLALGCWMLSSFGGNYLAGHLGALFPYMNLSSFFTMLASIALGNSIALALVSRPLSRRLAL